MLFCTPVNRVIRIRSSRERLAKMISQVITEKILDMFAEDDLIDGYEKEVRECGQSIHSEQGSTRS